MMTGLRGIFTPFIVPTTADGALNEGELRRYLHWLLSQGVHGLYPNGSTGEFVRFTLEQRRRIVAIAAEEAGGYVTVLAGVAEPTVAETLASCEAYAALGCTTVSLCPPYYFRLSQEAVLAYFREIARQTPVPVLLYQIPSFANALAPETILALMDEPNIVGLKDSSRDFAAFVGFLRNVRQRRPDFACFTGTEELLLPALIMGADGGTIATSGVAPEAVLGLYRAYENGDLATARDWQFALLALIGLMFGPDFPAGFRAGVTARGFDVGWGPQPLSERQREELSELTPRLRSAIAELLRESEGRLNAHAKVHAR